MDAALKYFEKNWEEQVLRLESMVRIQSVSFDGFDPSQVQKSAEAVMEMMTSVGLDAVEIIKLEGAHPYVYGEKIQNPDAPTLLLYAHHDVQPPGREHVWKTEPFEPTKKEGPGGVRLYGRGAADDKAGVLVHLAAIEAYLKTDGALPVNVKVLIEGEEETGSEHLFEFLSKYKEKLDADVLVLTDTLNYDCGIPGLTVALRGLVGLDVEVRSLNNTVHSGMWGGPIPDPAMALCKVIAQMMDDEGNILVPGVAELCPPLTEKDQASLKSQPFEESRFREQAGLVSGASLLQPHVHPLLQLWRLPSLSVNAIQSSSRDQAGNVINDTAWAKVSIRVAPGMDPSKVSEKLVAFVKEKMPWGLEVDCQLEVAAGAWSTDPDSPSNAQAFKLASDALTDGYGKAPVMMGCGGTIPFVEPFSKALGGAPAILVGVEDPFTNAHGENESVLLSDLKKACESQIRLFDKFKDYRG